MSEGQGKRRIGQGMKPRDKQAEDKHSHPLTHKDHTEPHEDCEECAAAVPTIEGQPESIIEPVLARQEGEQSGDSLEPEKVQNLDSEKTAGVAQSDELDANKSIEQMLRESGDFDSKHLAEGDTAEKAREEGRLKGPFEVTHHLTHAEMDATAKKVADQFVRELTLEEMEALAPINEIRIEQVQLAMTHPYGNPLGLQPDGSYKIVTTIPEGYWQAVKDWAESDGVTVEEWIDRQLSSYLENWGSPAKGR